MCIENRKLQPRKAFRFSASLTPPLSAMHVSIFINRMDHTEGAIVRNHLALLACGISGLLSAAREGDARHRAW